VSVGWRQRVPSPRRSWRLVQRSLLVYKHDWMIIFSGFFEPVFYLFGIGFGLGALISTVDGVGYVAFVAPGLLAASCMNGAIADGFFNIFFKLHYDRTYDGILATPMRVPDVAFGEMIWALGRGSLYALAFLVTVLAIGAVSGTPALLSWTSVLALPGAILTSASFAAIALCITSVAQKVEDFDLVFGLGVMPLFLFSGTFFPVSRLPDVVRWIVEALPLYHGTALLRQLTTGQIDASIVVHVVYLVVVGVAAFATAMWRLERTLVK
jgi:lipooligosaccharide transport system permease protein